MRFSIRIRRPTLAVSFFVVCFAAAACAPDANVGDVSQAQVIAWIEQGKAPVLLDVRSPEEYASGHVPGAINIPHDQLAPRVGEIEGRRDQAIVVYCESGRRAARAADTLEADGFSNIRHLTGDMSAWRNEGLVIE